MSYESSIELPKKEIKICNRLKGTTLMMLVEEAVNPNKIVLIFQTHHTTIVYHSLLHVFVDPHVSAIMY